MIVELILEALKNLSRHKLRSFLTALGIIFGIASVVAMVSTGEGARRAILSQIEELGVTNIIVNSKQPPAKEDVSGEEEEAWVQTYGLTFHDAEQIRKTVGAVVEVLPVHDLSEFVWVKSRRLEAKIRGITPRYFERLHMKISRGRLLTSEDGRNSKRTCVVRPRLLKEMKFLGDPLTLDVKIGQHYFRVVGVLDEVEFQTTNKAALGIDARALEIYVPFETVEARYGLVNSSYSAGNYSTSRVELNQILCAASDESRVVAAARGIQGVLSKFHDDRDYEVIVPLELLESRRQTQRVFDIVLPIIAGISLVVGGIGILNIMLASITERTQEIGIRRAIGATRLDITAQFLVETVTLAAVGGVLGVGLGWVGARVLTEFTEWNAVITPWAIGLSMVISCLTGIVFGLYPARRAAMMDPIESLRRE